MKLFVDHPDNTQSVFDFPDGTNREDARKTIETTLQQKPTEDVPFKPQHNAFDKDLKSMETILPNIGDTPRNFMIQVEGNNPKPHDDGAGFTTIGIGHKLTPKELETGKLSIGEEEIEWKKGLTQVQMNTLFEEDFSSYWDVAGDLIERSGLGHVPNMQTSLASLMFNSSSKEDPEAGFKKVAPEAYNALLRGDLEAFKFQAFDAESGIVRVGDKVFRGLVNRRRAELELLSPTRGIERAQVGPAAVIGGLSSAADFPPTKATEREVTPLSPDADLGDEIVGDLPTKESAAEFTDAFKMSDEQLAVLDKEREAVSTLIAEGKFMEASAASPETNKMLVFNMLGAGIIKSVGKAGLRLIQGGGKTTPPDPPILEVYKGGAPTAAEEAATLARKEQLDEAARIIDDALAGADKKKVKDALRVVEGDIGDHLRSPLTGDPYPPPGLPGAPIATKELGSDRIAAELYKRSKGQLIALSSKEIQLSKLVNKYDDILKEFPKGKADPGGKFGKTPRGKKLNGQLNNLQKQIDEFHNVDLSDAPTPRPPNIAAGQQFTKAAFKQREELGKNIPGDDYQRMFDEFDDLIPQQQAEAYESLAKSHDIHLVLSEASNIRLRDFRGARTPKGPLRLGFWKKNKLLVSLEKVTKETAEEGLPAGTFLLQYSKSLGGRLAKSRKPLSQALDDVTTNLKIFDKPPILPAGIAGTVAGEKALEGLETDDVIKGQQGADVLGATHTVVSGDTLSKIARDNNTTVAAIMDANRDIKDANKIGIGDQINLEGTAPAAAEGILEAIGSPDTVVSKNGKRDFKRTAENVGKALDMDLGDEVIGDEKTTLGYSGGLFKLLPHSNWVVALNFLTGYKGIMDEGIFRETEFKKLKEITSKRILKDHNNEIRYHNYDDPSKPSQSSDINFDPSVGLVLKTTLGKAYIVRHEGKILIADEFDMPIATAPLIKLGYTEGKIVNGKAKATPANIAKGQKKLRDASFIKKMEYVLGVNDKDPVGSRAKVHRWGELFGPQEGDTLSQRYTLGTFKDLGLKETDLSKAEIPTLEDHEKRMLKEGRLNPDNVIALETPFDMPIGGA